MFKLEDGTTRYKDATQFMRDYIDSRPVYVLSDDGMDLLKAVVVTQRFNPSLFRDKEAAVVVKGSFVRRLMKRIFGRVA